MTAPKPIITLAGENVYEARDGKVSLYFTLNNNFDVTITHSSNFLAPKQLAFVESKPLMLLNIGRLLKYIAGWALKQKDEAGK